MTSRARRVIAAIALVVLAPYPAAGGQQPKPASVAIVAALTGTAWVTIPGDRGATALRLFQWLPAKALIEVGKESGLTLVFSSGARYELGATAKVTAGTDAVASSSGPVRVVEAVPPLPRIAPIAAESRAGSRPGAVRIRGTTITRLYPDARATALADTTVLRFMPLPDASRYQVDVHTDFGASVFRTETQLPTVTIAPGVLKPGAKYHWEVRTLDRIGQAARGAAEFVTLDAEAVQARTTLKQSLEAAGDAASLALLAEIDRSLGLLVEAREEFRAALAKAPDDVALRQAFDRLEQQLAAEDEPKLM
jgi:hypothetical protein